MTARAKAVAWIAAAALVTYALAVLMLAAPREARAQQGPIYCQQAAALAGFTTLAQLIAVPSGSARIFICGWVASSLTASAITFSYGTGTNCGTGTTATGPTIETAATDTKVDASPNYRGWLVPPGQALCVAGSAAANIHLYYTQQ